MRTFRWILLLFGSSVVCAFVVPPTPRVSSNRPSPLFVSSVQVSTSATTKKKRTKFLVNETIAYEAPNLQVKQETTSSLPLASLAVAGALATFAGDLCIHPIDCVKTFQQSELGYGMSISETVEYLWQTYGINAFTHGFWTYGISDAFSGAAKFAMWESYKSVFRDKRLYVGAALAFLCSSIFLVPGELLKQQLQMGYYENWLDALSSIYRNDGISGLYTGYTGVLLRDIPHTILELCLYEHTKKLIQMELVAAAITGGITAILTTPLDCIKTKLMVDNMEQHLGVSELVFQTVSDHGIAGLFCGVVARVCWIVPFTVIYLPTYDLLKSKLSEIK